MEPSYAAGDRLLVNRLSYLWRAPLPGEVVVLRDPEDRRRLLIKRVAAAPAGIAGVWVLGDNMAASRDSRQFGAVSRAAIVGRAWLRY